MRTLLPHLIAGGAGLIAGVLFAFSNFVMRALGQLPTAQGVAAMQRINIVVLNPLFLVVFLGTAMLAGFGVATAVVSWGETRATLLVIAGLSYLVGCVGVTAVFNIPRNQRLAWLSPESPDAEEYWPVYLREWMFWNHVRTVASIVAAASAAAAAVV